MLFLATGAGAALREEQLQVPVEVKDAYGKQIRHTITVTYFHDDADATPRPVVVINHGRAGDAQGRLALGRARYAAAARWFVQRGFVVAVPTRIGYGVTSGEDVEDEGPCRDKRFTAPLLAAATQVQAALDAVRERPQSLKDRAVIVGQSVGGAATVATVSRNPAGVVAAINFAGGGGGDPKNRPRTPCGSTNLEHTYADFGKTARVPMLWIYTENDLYWGPKIPREWHQAFVAGGASAEFVAMPPHGEDGHGLFTEFPQAWQPVVANFLRTQGFPMKGEGP